MLLVLRPMVRGSQHLSLAAMLPCFYMLIWPQFVACILPPEDRIDTSAPYPPYVNPTRLDPPTGVVLLNTECTLHSVLIQEIADYDSNTLNVRWVANNNLESTNLLSEYQLRLFSEETIEDGWRLAPREDLSVNPAGPVAGDIAVLSYFLTDAPSWEFEDDGTTKDLGSIPEGEGYVVEVRWTFTFGETGDCKNQ